MLTVALIAGGSSPEAEVSRNSAAQIQAALEGHFHVHLLELDPSVAKHLQALAVDVAFPVLHGCPGEDGTIQGVLETLEIPFVGSGVMASAVAMNKVFTKQILSKFDVPLAKDFVFYGAKALEPQIEACINALGSDLVVKPSAAGSALGVSFAATKAELMEAVDTALRVSDILLVEECVRGKEITVAVHESSSGIKSFPVIDIVTPENAWYDYEHRYTAGLYEHVIPAPLPDMVSQRLSEIAIFAHEQLQCRDFSRSDFIVTAENDIIYLETNTIPGMTKTSLYPDAANAAGISFETLVRDFVIQAYERHPKSQTERIVANS